LWDEDLSACSLTLPKWGSMRDGVLLERMTLALPTAANDAGLWRTPTVGMLNADRAKDPEYTARKEAKGQTITLADQVKNPRMWPTPTVCGNHNRKGASATSGDGLATAVKNWPTPTASLGTKGGRVTPRKSREGGTLIESVSSRSFATPTARDWRSGKASEATMGRNSRPLSEQIGGQLNPNWVEWLMGWPLGWTDLKPLEMDKCRNARQKHGGC
jgi:hypothetical protein